MDNSFPRTRIGVFIGRFQPFHLGHERAIAMALEKVDTLLVIVGSANEPRTARNPFTAPERVGMIRGCFPDEKRLVIVALEDSDYNTTAWIEQVHALVHDTARTDRARGDQSDLEVGAPRLLEQGLGLVDVLLALRQVAPRHLLDRADHARDRAARGLQRGERRQQVERLEHETDLAVPDPGA